MKTIHLTAYGNPAQNLKLVAVSEPKALSITPREIYRSEEVRILFFGGTYDHKINSEQKGRRNMKEKQVKLPGPDHSISVQSGLYTRFYQDTVENIRRWLDGQAIGG
jgi:hypothetical protein